MLLLMRAFMLFSVLAAAGCNELRPCTLIGCGAPFEVQFTKASAWPAGSYHVEVEADGVRSACTMGFPLTSCQVAVGCEGTADWRMNLSGCALPAAAQSISGLTFLTTRPAAVKVTVSHEQRTLGTGTFTPTYTTSRPNGPSCEPECRTAPSASLSLE